LLAGLVACVVVGQVAGPLRWASTLAVIIASLFWMISGPLTLLGHIGAAMQAVVPGG
jgi:hypothetical protein